MRTLFLTHFPPEVDAPANRTHEHARRWIADEATFLARAARVAR